MINDVENYLWACEKEDEIDEDPQIECLRELKEAFGNGKDLTTYYRFYSEIKVAGEQWGILEVSKEEMIEEIISAQEWKRRKH